MTLGLAYYYFLRPQMLKFGTQYGEAQRRLPGDELLVEPGFAATRAVNIAAPPEAVWPWLAQMGRDSTGFYGLDWLTNRGIPSAAYLRTDLPELQVGLTLDDGSRVLQFEPNRMLLYGGFEIRSPFGETMERTTLFLVEARENGKQTRLIVRVRGYIYGALGPLYNKLYEVFDFVQGYAQLNNLRDRAEVLARLTQPVTA